MKILYFSSMIVSPGSDGGRTVSNLIELCLIGGEVLYSTPTAYLPYRAPFPEISSRLCWFPWDRALPTTKYGRRVRIARELDALFDLVNATVMRERTVRKSIRHIEQREVYLVLLSIRDFLTQCQLI